MSIRRRIKVEQRDRKDVLNEAIISQDEFLEKFYSRPGKFQFFFGAGMSVSAGIPLSRDIIDEIIVKVFEKTNPAKRGQMTADELSDWVSREKWFNPNYAYISALEKEFPSVYLRTELFRRYMEGRFPSPAQLNFAIGVKEGKLNNRVYTTNWDTLTEDAFYWLRGTNCVTIKGPDQLVEVKDEEHRYVVKVHGDLDRYDVRYLREGMAKHNDDLRDFLVKSMSNVGLVVMGYSGTEYSVMNMLMEIVHDYPDVLSGGLYWGYQGNMKHVPETITDLMAIGLDKGKDFRIFETDDADFLFEKVAGKLGFAAIESELDVAFFRFNKMGYGELREREGRVGATLADLVHRDLLDEGFLVRDYNLIHEVWKSEQSGMFKKKEEKERAARDAERKLINHCFNDLKHQQYADAEVKLTDVAKHFPENPHVYWGLGWANYSMGRYREALEFFDRSLALEPKSWGTYIARAMCQHDLGQYSEEMANYDKVLELKGNIDYIWYNRGLAAHKLGDRRAEIESYESAVSVNGGYYKAWYNLGLCYYEQGNILTALNCFKRARDINSRFFNARFNCGILLGKMGQDGQAIHEFEHCIELNEDDDMSFKQRGTAELMISKYDKAQESFEEFTHTQPGDPEAWANLGLSYYGTEHYDEALEYTDKYLDRFPEDARIWYNRGLVQEQLGDREKAMQAFDKSLELNNDNDMVWYRKALLLGNLGEFNGQIEFLTKFLNRNSQDLRGWFELGEANRKLGEAAESREEVVRYYTAAVQAYDKALECDRTHLETWLNKTVALNRLNRYDEALECINYLLRYDKKNAEVYYQKGIAEDGLGDQLSAADTFAQALKLNENHADSYYRRGLLLAELEQFAKAVDHFDNAIRLRPDKWQAYHYKGISIIRQKEYDKALEVFEEALERFEDKPRFYVDSALAHVMKRNIDDARKCLNTAITRNPNLKAEIMSTPEFSGLVS
ncbi:MAG: tetratricopeptide repeat protein [bacterium]